MKIFWIVLTLFISLFALPSSSRADGGVMPAPGYYVRETDQKAVIVHQNDVETMILSVTFQGNAKNFAWVVPTPSKPIVTESSDGLFTALQELTKANTDIIYDRMPTMGLGSAEVKKPTVAVLETKRVGIFEIKVLAANDSQALANWLAKNGYQYPKEFSYVLDSYIENGWYFTAIKVNATLAGSSSISSQLKSGHATPLQFTFNSKKIVFPLKISGIVSEVSNQKSTKFPLNNTTGTNLEIMPIFPPITQITGSSITLYIFSDHKVDGSTFTTKYASWMSAPIIERLAQGSQGDPWMKIDANRLYLTKLYRYAEYSEMTSDIYLTRASDNIPVGVDYVLWWLVIVMILLMFIAVWLSPFGITFIISAIVNHYTKSPTTKTVVVVLEYIMMFLVFLSSLIICISYVAMYPELGNLSTLYYLLSLAVGAILSLALMTIWRILESKRNKKLLNQNE